MFKKFFSSLFLGCFFLCSTSFASTPADNPNLVLFYQHQGYQNFLLKNSLRSYFDNSLIVISFNFITFDSIQPDNTRWDQLHNMAFAFDESNRKVYFYDNGSLTFLDPSGTVAQGSGYAQGADLIFNLVFGRNFYVCPAYLDADKNFILFADLGAHDAGLYVDSHTCSIAYDSPSQLIILIDSVEVPGAAFGKTRIVNRFSHRYMFDLQHNSAFRYEPFNDLWLKIDPSISNPEDVNFTYDATIAEIAYFLAFGKKFFTSY